METFQLRVNPVPAFSGFLAACLLATSVALMAGCDSKTEVDPTSADVEPNEDPAELSGIEVEGSAVSFQAAEPPAVTLLHAADEIVAPPEPSVEADVVQGGQESEEMDFFNAPRVSVESQHVIEATDDSAPLRLIGFISVPTETGVTDKAILKIGDKLLTLAAGEIADGVEILEVDDRSVTIQRDRQRRTLGLFDQPLVNPVVVRQSTRSRYDSRSRSKSSRGTSRSVDRDQAAANWLPDLPLGPANLPQGTVVPGQSSPGERGIEQLELPELPDFPEPPELDLPGTDLP